VSVLAGLLASLSYQYGFTYTIVLLALLLVGLFLLGVYLSRVQVIRAAGALTAETRIVRLAADFPFKRQVATVMIDLVLIVAAYYTAYLLRFEAAFELHRETFFRTVAPVIIIQVSAMALSGSYRGLWRYTSLPELVRLLRGATLGSGATVLYMLFTTRFESLSRAVFILDWLLLVLFLSGSRISFRVFGELLRPARTDFQRVLIYGAGDGGELTLRELRKNSGLRRQAVGFLDDDPAKAGTRIHEVPVLGGVEAADDLVARYGVGEVIVASDRISVAQVRRLEIICAARGIRVVRAALRIE
jgi:UDP-GlcNAc:undecaprenyl-phosphate GlcNAc-1-phosphate transferase